MTRMPAADIAETYYYETQRSESQELKINGKKIICSGHNLQAKSRKSRAYLSYNIFSKRPEERKMVFSVIKMLFSF